MTQKEWANVSSLQKQRKEKKMPLKRKGKNQSWTPSKRTEWKLIFNKIEVVVMMLNDLHWLVWSIQVLSGFSHFWLVLSPLPYVLALSSACLVAMAHEVFSQLLNYVGSLLGCCWFLIDRHNNSLLGFHAMKSTLVLFGSQDPVSAWEKDEPNAS